MTTARVNAAPAAQSAVSLRPASCGVQVGAAAGPSTSAALTELDGRPGQDQRPGQNQGPGQAEQARSAAEAGQKESGRDPAPAAKPQRDPATSPEEQPHSNRVPGLVVGGTSSNAGKTLTTLALLCALQRRGLHVHAAKTGPDYIDTAFHAGLTQAPAANLDCWMCTAALPATAGASASSGLTAAPAGLAGLPGLQNIFARMQRPDSRRTPDILVVEGAMGLYDGGAGGSACTAQLAALLDLPVLLLLNVHGLGQSAAALAEGFLQHRPLWAGQCGLPRFAGLLCTHVGGTRHREILQEALTPVSTAHAVPLLGFLPREHAPQLPSRHLGLVQAHESLPTVDHNALADWFEENTCLDALLSALGLSQSAQAAARRAAVPAGAAAGPGTVTGGLPPAAAGGETDSPAAALLSLSASGTAAGNTAGNTTGSAASEKDPEATAPAERFYPPLYIQPAAGRRLRVGMAWDAAFSFCYADLPALLQEEGAELCFFSPLRDAAPPACDGLYFPGGYPELHAAALQSNTAMYAALRALADTGLPMYGECGGYIYLMDAVEHRGQSHAMCGLLPLHCRVGEKRAALGYRAATALPGWLPCPQAQPLTVRGHEFHYAALQQEALPPGCHPLWQVTDSAGRPLGLEGCRCGSVAGSWLHLYPEGARDFWKSWLQGLRQVQ